MQTKIFKTDDNSIAEAGRILKDGGLVAFPTETVYGLGGNALMPDSVKKIYKAKGRPSDNPLIVHIADLEDIKPLVSEINDNAKALIDAFMPGPFTVILRKSELVPDTVTAEMDTVAIRFPENETAQRLIRAAGVPIAAPSANISGKPSPTRASHVIDDLSGRIDAIIDGENCMVGVESTIVDATGDVPVLLRPGGITYDEICEIVPETVIDEHILNSLPEGEKPLCPGMKYTHYSPEADVYVVEGNVRAVRKKINELLEQNSDKHCGVLTMSRNTYNDALIIYGGMTNKEYAKGLFANLREFDRLGVDVVFAELCCDDEYSMAVKNRIYKSAGHKVIKTLDL